MSRAAAGGVPLSGRTVHDNVDPQDLHGIQRVGEVHQRRQGDERQRCDAPAGRDGETKVRMEVQCFTVC